MHFTIFYLSDIKVMVLFCGLERTPTIYPPFADISPLFFKTKEVSNLGPSAPTKGVMPIK